MNVIVVILIALGAGWFVGSRFESAHDAHQRFHSYRLRTNSSLGDWLKSVITAAIGIVGLAALLYLIVFIIRVR